MHEMGLAEGILAVALDVAGAERIERVRVRVGELQRVTPDSLRFCFELAAQDTPAAHAVLDVDVTAGSDAMVEAVKVTSGWRRRPGAHRSAAEAT
jgi:hydrogenase nickel incorporation protein HypA/HybF